MGLRNQDHKNTVYVLNEFFGWEGEGVNMGITGNH